MHHGHHHHDHNHNPGHTHVPESGNTRAFLAGIALNLAFVLIEFAYGYWSDSLALMADAGHNLGDVAGLGISLMALRMAGLRPNAQFTYGYSKGTVLASLANAMLLLLAVGGIWYEAIYRLKHPVAPAWQTVSLVAAIGIVINTATALLFMNRKEMNSRAAFLHMAADAAVSAAVVLGGFLIDWTGYLWIDPALSILIGAVIVAGTWKLLRSSIRLSLDGVPDHIRPEQIRQTATGIDGVLDIHHLHIWAVSTTKTALTAHLLVREGLSGEELQALKENIRHQWYHQGIHHATIETEIRHTHDCEEC